MNEEKPTNQQPSDEENQAAKDAKKRFSYVSKDLKSVIDFITKVHTQLGHTDYHSNKAIATANSLAPESIKGYLSSAQQYKLLEIKHGTGYKITELFQRIFLWKNENEKRTAIIESLKSPETYQQLFKDYEYNIVPFEGVKNHFIRSFGFDDKTATKATQIFTDNLKEFELLDGRGVLTSAMPNKPIVPEVTIPKEDLKNDVPDNIEEDEQTNLNNLPARQPRDRFVFQSEIEAAGKKTIPIYLLGTKQALFVYPDDITEDDIELVKHQIDGILLRIKLEAKAKAAKQEGQ